MNEDLEITPLKTDLEALFFFGSEKQKYQNSNSNILYNFITEKRFNKIKEWRMQIIDGKKYYSVKEIQNKINEACNFNFKKNYAIYQQLYRLNFPFILKKSEEADFQYRLYSEDVLIELTDYYYRKKKSSEYWKEIKRLRAENTAFNKKYKIKNAIKNIKNINGISQMLE